MNIFSIADSLDTKGHFALAQYVDNLSRRAYYFKDCPDCGELMEKDDFTDRQGNEYSSWVCVNPDCPSKDEDEEPHKVKKPLKSKIKTSQYEPTDEEKRIDEESFMANNTENRDYDSYLREFEEQLKNHDWLYEFSDDFSVWRRGVDTEKKLLKIAEDLGPEGIALFKKYLDLANKKIKKK